MLELLKNAAKIGKLAHGYLFYGGTFEEMKNAAFGLAYFLKTSTFDILYIVPLEDKKEISIDQIRKARKHLSLSPYNSFYKFAIIDGAEAMNSEAANALLKTLEEPQGNTILILIASKPDLLPKTIISRLQEIRFKPLPLSKISDNFINQEHVNILNKPLDEIFNYIEKISKTDKDSGEILSLLDSWLFWFRKKMIHPLPRASDDKQKTLEIIQEIQKTKDMISSSNVNQRLVLENLVLCINNY